MCPGVGRGFLSRQLLGATSVADGIAIVSDPRGSGGHNYQLFSFGSGAGGDGAGGDGAGGTAAPSVSNVEVAPRGVYAVRPMGAAAWCYSNRHPTRYKLHVASCKLQAKGYRLHAANGRVQVASCELRRFHANQYQTLSVPQTFGNSSVHR